MLETFLLASHSEMQHSECTQAPSGVHFCNLCLDWGWKCSKKGAFIHPHTSTVYAKFHHGSERVARFLPGLLKGLMFFFGGTFQFAIDVQSVMNREKCGRSFGKNV